MKINTPKDLGAVIKDRRKSKKWTQAELASRIGVYQRDISNFETKPDKITVDILIKLCAVLNLDFNVASPSDKVGPARSMGLRF